MHICIGKSLIQTDEVEKKRTEAFLVKIYLCLLRRGKTRKENYIVQIFNYLLAAFITFLLCGKQHQKAFEILRN